MGEDVHRLNGGTNGATRGLAEQFPDRVLGTPISENAFTGLAGGMALDGRFRPVVELMYADFMWVAADQLFNQIGKARHMFGGDGTRAVRAAHQGRHGHRLRLAALDGPGRASSPRRPGWRIVAPSTPFDYVGLMNTRAGAARTRWSCSSTSTSTRSTGTGPVDDLDYCLPVGKAAVRRSRRRRSR